MSFNPTVMDQLLNLIQLPPKYSDIHIEEREPVMLMGPGGWSEADLDIAAPFEDASMEELVSVLTNKAMTYEQLRAHVSQHGELGRAMDLRSCRLRTSFYSVEGGSKLAISLRRQPLVPTPLSELGLSHNVRACLSARSGLLLVTGPTGSGKTTSIAAMVDHINANRAAHIITIEDPIEFTHPRKKGLVSPKEVGSADGPDYATILKASMRHRPQVLVVGEIRDRETAELVFQAGESGHLVLATMHSSSAIGSLHKLLSWFPEEFNQRALLLSQILRGVVTQALVPTADRGEWLLATEHFFNNSEQVADIIKSPMSWSELAKLMDAPDKPEHRSMNQSLAALVKQGVVTTEDALAVSQARLNLQERLGSLAMSD